MNQALRGRLIVERVPGMGWARDEAGRSPRRLCHSIREAVFRKPELSIRGAPRPAPPGQPIRPGRLIRPLQGGSGGSF
jgi:hypothetical protein